MPVVSNKVRSERRVRAQEWKVFRANNMFTQRRLAQVIGCSRRTVQQVEGAYVVPHLQTLRNFEALKAKYLRNADVDVQPLNYSEA